MQLDQHLMERDDKIIPSASGYLLYRVTLIMLRVLRFVLLSKEEAEDPLLIAQQLLFCNHRSLDLDGL